MPPSAPPLPAECVPWIEAHAAIFQACRQAIVRQYPEGLRAIVLNDLATGSELELRLGLMDQVRHEATTIFIQVSRRPPSEFLDALEAAYSASSASLPPVAEGASSQSIDGGKGGGDSTGQPEDGVSGVSDGGQALARSDPAASTPPPPLSSQSSDDTKGGELGLEDPPTTGNDDVAPTTSSPAPSSPHSSSVPPLVAFGDDSEAHQSWLPLFHWVELAGDDLGLTRDQEQSWHDQLDKAAVPDEWEAGPLEGKMMPIKARVGFAIGQENPVAMRLVREQMNRETGRT